MMGLFVFTILAAFVLAVVCSAWLVWQLLKGLALALLYVADLAIPTRRRR